MSLATDAASAARFARRELRGGLRGFRIFLACLALGVAAIAGIGMVRASIQMGLEEKGAELLGGDAEVRFTYRFAEAEERAWMAARATKVSEITDFRSMVVVDGPEGTERALTQIKSVDANYPLLGAVTLAPDMPLDQALADHGAVMAPVLADRLGLEPGDNFRLGTQDFTLSALLMVEPDNAGGGFSLGPRTLVRTDALTDSGLLQPGTLFETHYRLQLPADTNLDTLETEARARFTETGGRWRDARNGAPGIGRFVDRLSNFLILVGLSGLAVGGVGVSAAVRAYLATKTSVIATLRTLGATRRVIFLTYFLQIGVLSLVGITIGLALGAIVPLALAPLLQSQLPVPAVFALHAQPLAEAALYGALTALIFTLWPLARTEDIRPATLFRDAMGGARLLPHWPYVATTLVLTAALLGAAALFSNSLWLTLWTAGGIIAALIVLALTAVLIRWIARRSGRAVRHRPALRWALSAISGKTEGAAATVLSLGLGLSVLASVGQIEGNMRAAIQTDLPEIAPSYFFVDIQKDQMPGFQARLDDDPAVSKVDSAPMLRGIITQINGQPARDVAGDHWVIRGDRGITYSAEIPADTTLTSGDWWPSDYSGPPLVSFAAEEAEEIGLKLGDELTVNILGRDITATIASFREVDFSTAGIGFVMSMNAAALSAAPHSFIATVYAEETAEAAILRDLATAYPNITAIRVRDAVDQVAGILTGIASATAWGAAATLLTGFLVLIGAAAAGIQARTYEAAVLKTLGAARARILQSFALRAILLGMAAGLVALGAGIAGGWAVMTYLMEVSYSVQWASALLIVFGGVMATLLAGLAFAWQPLAARPAQVLRARE
ncbi:FtsX-like permease family protein [Marinovum sp. 2_MG-2023]|nr:MULTISPECIES: FtsX-like permease family protein [unclassified Marinovum]MDO6730818.1 FtsX-like permease family protein [Marinovum sp. 2_MG-2023]MDO6779977.1 FtsX-like permease family protein [Marinovum sp. 1_MG-2023]